MLLLFGILLGFASLIAILILFLNPPEAWVKKFFNSAKGSNVRRKSTKETD